MAVHEVSARRSSRARRSSTLTTATGAAARNRDIHALMLK
jgi:hypothetical protein